MLPIFNLTGLFDKTCDLSDTYYTNKNHTAGFIGVWICFHWINTFIYFIKSKVSGNLPCSIGAFNRAVTILFISLLVFHYIIFSNKGQMGNFAR